METFMSTMPALEGLAILAVVLLISANWQKLTTDAEEDAVSSGREKSVTRQPGT